MLSAPTPDELTDWLRVAGTATATGTLLWTPGDEPLSFGWTSWGTPPVLVDLPTGVEVRFAYGGPGRWALDGPNGPLGRSDGSRGVAWRDSGVDVGGSLIPLPHPEWLLLPEPPQHSDGEVVEDQLLGRSCWRWSAGGEVRWVDDTTGCLLRLRTPAGTLAMTSFTPGAPVDPSLFDLEELAGPHPAARASQVRAQPAPGVAAFTVPWWPHGALSYPVAGDPEVPSLLVLLNTGDSRAPSVWVGVAPLGVRAPVRPGVRSRRWDGEDCALSLSWTADLSDADVDRIVRSIPGRWP